MEKNKKVLDLKVKPSNGKKMMSVILKDIFVYDIRGNLENTIELFQYILKSYKDQYDDIQISFPSTFEEYNCDNYISIIGLRIETDKEYQTRIKLEEKEKLFILKKEESEKKLLEKLKKKYEKS